MNIFNHKTKFFFLWEYIEDIQLVPATLALMGSPCLLIIFRKGRGFDAKRGAKQLDCEGVADFSIILPSGPSPNIHLHIDLRKRGRCRVISVPF
jgi:hypothetical protein